MIEKVKSYLEQVIDHKAFPGCACAVITKENIALITAGRFTYDINSPLIDEHSIFDVASITKAVPVSTLALKLIELDELKLTDFLVKYVPEYNGNYREQITVHHLLTQTLAFSFKLSDYKDKKPSEIISSIMNAKLQYEPGRNCSYANATSILLGMVIERCSGMSLENAAIKYFFKPLSMQMTSFYPEKFDKQNIVPTEIDLWRNRVVQGEVHDESAYAMRPTIVGSAGLFTTISDLSKFISMLVNEGEASGQQILKPETVHGMYSNQFSYDSNMYTGLGWELNQYETMGKQINKNIFGKTGFTGCSIAINPFKSIGYILLSNHLYPKRKENRSFINEIRRTVAEIVLN